MRDHYEGTPLSVADGTDIGGGIWQMPYRPTPLMFKVDGKQYFNERPVSTQQSGFVFVSQMRSWMPREIGGVFWFGNDDANMAGVHSNLLLFYRVVLSAIIHRELML